MNGNRAVWDAKYFCVARAELEGDSITYTGGAQAWDLISVSVTPNVISAPHTSETGGRKVRYKALGADMTLGHEPETLEKKALLFGHTMDESTSEMATGINDKPQHVGCAYYKALNDDTYEGAFYPWAVFSEGTDEANGALDGITYTTKSTNGSAEADPLGNYEYKKAFETEQEAMNWVRQKLSMTLIEEP